MKVNIARKTKETNIELSLDIYGEGKGEINSGVGFFDHMLSLFAFHGKFDLAVNAKGDLKVDTHHTVEDIGIALGLAFKDSLKDKKGIARYGSFYVPMDEALALCSLDISGRPFLVLDCPIESERIGEFEAQMLKEFLWAFAYNAGITLHVKVLYGDNDHHKIEAVFKAFARALRQAVTKTGEDAVPSSKGAL